MHIFSRITYFFRAKPRKKNRIGILGSFLTYCKVIKDLLNAYSDRSDSIVPQRFPRLCSAFMKLFYH